MSTRKPPEQFTVVLTDTPGYDAPVIIRLRRWLKTAGRVWRLRCIRVEPGDRMRPAGDGDQDGRAA